MILQGRDLIVSADGLVIAAAKSCDLSVQCYAIKRASLTQGSWQEVIAGMKSWSLATNHLMPVYGGFTSEVEAVGYCQNGNGYSNVGSLRVGSRVERSNISRGLTIYDVILADGQISSIVSKYTWDTYAGNQELDNFCQNLDQIVAGHLVAIVSYDAIQINDDMVSMMSEVLGITVPTVSTANGRRSFAAVGIAGETTGMWSMNPLAGSCAHVKMLLRGNSNTPVINSTPLKDAVARVGTSYTLSIRCDGLSPDRLTGSALCVKADVRGTLGSLATGSFSFTGNGPLQ